MYIDIHSSDLAKLLKIKGLKYLGRSDNGDFIWDWNHYRIRINFSLKKWRFHG